MCAVEGKSDTSGDPFAAAPLKGRLAKRHCLWQSAGHEDSQVWVVLCSGAEVRMRERRAAL